MTEILDIIVQYWDIFYNEWLKLVPEQYKPTVIAVAIMLAILGGTVIRYRRKLGHALKGHHYLNKRIDELREQLAKKPEAPITVQDDLRAYVKEAGGMFDRAVSTIEASSNKALTLAIDSAARSREAMAATCKEMMGKFETTVAKSMERTSVIQDAGNKLLNETIRQFIELSKANHSASMRVVSEAVSKKDDDDDDEDEE